MTPRYQRLLALTALLVPLASSEPARAATTLLVGDRGGSMIWRVDAATGAATIFATGIDEPEDLEVDVDGSALVMRRSAASPTTAQITRISADGLTVTAVTAPGEVEGWRARRSTRMGTSTSRAAGTAARSAFCAIPRRRPGSAWPRRSSAARPWARTRCRSTMRWRVRASGVLTVGPLAGDLLLTAPNEFRVNRFTSGNPFAGPFVFAGPADFPLTGRAFGPVDVKQSPTGEIYVTDANGRLLRYTSDGMAVNVVIDEAGGLELPGFLAIPGDGVVYFTQIESSPARIGRWDAVAGTRLSDLVIDAFERPLGLAGSSTLLPPAGCRDFPTRAQIDSECDCVGATKHGAYVKCAVHVINRAIKAHTLPRARNGAVKKCAARSTSGKPGFVTCCRTTAKGMTHCSIKSAPAKCKAPKGGSARVGDHASCCDACTGTGCGFDSRTPTTKFLP